ncbi:MarR family winged helix-turn-helix transcriptional regulator [Methanolobus vulcani]|jgi:DNA-binding MarR family transcriptional regulator|uniref:MarR family transcriptional regulator n=1 Tax=Methanolobus vulcani TaxID=38026 RepID=A0A7Z8P0W9_9EURY|nr:MarR family transcriptional regulator [Methanolobus vulcani]TQD24962.1 MarR family transcriptional regulator [Methanolobus vulcani]
MKQSERIGAKIAYIFSHNHRYIERALESYNLKGPMFAFLLTLSHKDGCSQECLARYLKFSKATATRVITTLEKQGYVYREKDEDDRRIYRVFISDEGRGLIPAINSALQEWNDIFLSDLSDEEEQIFRNLLDKTKNTLVEFDRKSSKQMKNNYQISG